jgi:hypothetical protein
MTHVAFLFKDAQQRTDGRVTGGIGECRLNFRGGGASAPIEDIEDLTFPAASVFMLKIQQHHAKYLHNTGPVKELFCEDLFSAQRGANCRIACIGQADAISRRTVVQLKRRSDHVHQAPRPAHPPSRKIRPVRLSSRARRSPMADATAP